MSPWCLVLLCPLGANKGDRCLGCRVQALQQQVTKAHLQEQDPDVPRPSTQKCRSSCSPSRSCSCSSLLPPPRDRLARALRCCSRGLLASRPSSSSSSLSSSCCSLTGSGISGRRGRRTTTRRPWRLTGWSAPATSTRRLRTGMS